jgi:hypothetical protein
MDDVTCFALIEEEAGFLSVDEIGEKGDAVFLKEDEKRLCGIGAFVEMSGDKGITQAFNATHIEIGALDDHCWRKYLFNRFDDFFAKEFHASGVDLEDDGLVVSIDDEAREPVCFGVGYAIAGDWALVAPYLCAATGWVSAALARAELQRVRRERRR